MRRERNEACKYRNIWKYKKTLMNNEPSIYQIKIFKQRTISKIDWLFQFIKLEKFQKVSKFFDYLF